MDHKTIVDDMWTEIYEKHYDDTENICAKIIAKAEKTADKPMKKKTKRALVIAASVAAAAALTVSVGAACNWDLRSLLINDYTRERKFAAEAANAYKAGNKVEPFMYGETVQYPEETGIYHELTAKELELLDRVTIPVEKTFEEDEHTLTVHGILYDGNVLGIRSTVTKNNGCFSDVVEQGNAWNVFNYTLLDENRNELPKHGGVGGTDENAIGKNSISGTRYTPFTAEHNVKKIIVVVGYAYTNSAGFSSYPMCGEFTVELPEVSDLSRTYNIDTDTVLGSSGRSHINNITFSPLGVSLDYDFNLDLRYKDLQSIHPTFPPVFITMKDGTVTEQNAKAVGNEYKINDDGSFYISWQAFQKNYLIDPFDIASVQIGNCTVELDDPMIVE
ncbi:MAG: hypothetical protein IJT87_08740 [Ruminiclostridium sp.]|nr:hypothetical protein [Ruminiclostridium sp.]